MVVPQPVCLAASPQGGRRGYATYSEGSERRWGLASSECRGAPNKRACERYLGSSAGEEILGDELYQSGVYTPESEAERLQVPNREAQRTY